MKSGVFQTIDLVQYNEQHCKKSTFYQPNAVNCAFVGAHGERNGSNKERQRLLSGRKDRGAHVVKKQTRTSVSGEKVTG